MMDWVVVVAYLVVGETFIAAWEAGETPPFLSPGTTGESWEEIDCS